MARVAPPRNAVATSNKDAVIMGKEDELPVTADEICPVCKSSRYLNPQMRFLVNPTCYHKMCSSCVDRIFSHGPAQCPIAKCHKTLRKHRFRKQTFDDMKIEREVDIRREVGEVFNRREDEFESLRDWNDYLEEVEDITYALIEGIDVEANRRKLERYRAEHASSIKTNANLAKDQIAALHSQEAAEKEEARLRRAAARREVEEERREIEEGRRRILDDLAAGRGDAEAIAKEGENRLKSSLLRRTEADRRQQQQKQQLQLQQQQQQSSTAQPNTDTFVIRGLKKRVEPEKEAPYDPFGDISFKPQYHVLQDYYDWDWLDRARTHVAIAAGGYDVQAYCQRALCEAFSGLGVFVSNEMAAKDASESMFPADTPKDKVPEKKKAKKMHRIEDDDVF